MTDGGDDELGLADPANFQHINIDVTGPWKVTHH